MPFELTLQKLPAGYAVTSGRPGDQLPICMKEFVSSEDGDHLISRLEGFPSEIVSLLPREASIKPPQIDHLLAIVRPNKTATVYVNELDMLAEIQAKRDLRDGENVFVDDIAEIRKLSFGKSGYRRTLPSFLSFPSAGEQDFSTISPLCNQAISNGGATMLKHFVDNTTPTCSFSTCSRLLRRSGSS